MVLVALVLAQVARFHASLKRKIGGCLEAPASLPVSQSRRFALELAHGPVDGKVISSCHSTHCVRPSHLEVAQ